MTYSIIYFKIKLMRFWGSTKKIWEFLLVDRVDRFGEGIEEEVRCYMLWLICFLDGFSSVWRRRYLNLKTTETKIFSCSASGFPLFCFFRLVEQFLPSWRNETAVVKMERWGIIFVHLEKSSHSFDLIFMDNTFTSINVGYIGLDLKLLIMAIDIRCWIDPKQIIKWKRICCKRFWVSNPQT